jgi:hypothetical protein
MENAILYIYTRSNSILSSESKLEHDGKGLGPGYRNTRSVEILSRV